MLKPLYRSIRGCVIYFWGWWWGKRRCSSKFLFLPLLCGFFFSLLYLITLPMFSGFLLLLSCLEVDVVLKMWGGIFSAPRLLKLLRGSWVWKAKCSRHGLQKSSFPPNSDLGRFYPCSPSKTQLSYHLYHFKKANSSILYFWHIGIRPQNKKWAVSHMVFVTYDFFPPCPVLILSF